MHLLCLLLTGSVGKERYGKLKKRRLAVAAFLCAVADAIAVVLGYEAEVKSSMLFLGISLLELFFGAWLAYGKRNLLQNTVLLFVVTVLLSGFFGLVPINNVGLFCLVGSLLLPLLKVGGTVLFRAKQTQASMFEARLYQGNREITLSSFMDTGNRLRLVGSEMPVVAVDEMCLDDWIKEAEKNTPQKLVFLPYKGVGGTGLLRGVRVQCRLNHENGSIIGGEVAAVAVEHKLFSGCEYQMILQPEVLKLPIQMEIRPDTVRNRKEKTMVCVKDTQEGESNVV